MENLNEAPGPVSGTGDRAEESSEHEHFTELLDAALDYAARGWPVFPVHSARNGRCTCGKAACSSPSKHPRTKNGLKDGTTDPERIRRWWKRWPTANVGIVTGAVSGLVVLDFDVKDGQPGEETLDKLRRENERFLSKSQQTPTGGWHVLFKHPNGEVRNRTSLLPGLDIRGDGGYIVAPPSVTAKGQYQWVIDEEVGVMPDGIRELLKPKPIASNSKAQPSDDRQIEQGARNQWLFKMACGLRRRGLSGRAIAAALLEENVARCNPPLDTAEVERIAKSAARYKPDRLKRNKDGVPKATLHNVLHVLQHNPAWVGMLAYNDFTAEIEKVEKPPYAQGEVGVWTDADNAWTANWIAQAIDFEPSTHTVAEAVAAVAETNRRHPVREYLDALKWDGEPRLHYWLADFLGAANTSYTQAVGRYWLIGAVARIYLPGCKMDNVMILEGAQGIGKSMALRILAGDDWFTDEPIKFGDKDSYMTMQGRWIIELAELESFRKAESEQAKLFLSKTTDRYRPPYGRYVVTFPRQCIFAGTANPDQYLKDPTGNRRYWPVEVTAVNVKALRVVRNQLLAEAVARFHAGERWWVDGNPEEFAAEQDKRTHQDPWEDALATWLEEQSKDFIFSKDILRDGLGIPVDRQSRADEMRTSTIMKRLNWRSDRQWNGDAKKQLRGYHRPGLDDQSTFVT